MKKLQWLCLMLAMALPLTVLQAQEIPSADFKPSQILQLGRGRIENVQWNPDSTYFMVTTIGGGWIYTPDLKEQAYIPARPAEISPDGRYIAGVDENDEIRIWDAHTFKLFESRPQNLLNQKIYQAGSIDWSPDGRYVIMTDNSLMNSGGGIWSLPYLDQYAGFPAYENLSWSPEGTYVAIQGYTPLKIQRWPGREVALPNPPWLSVRKYEADDLNAWRSVFFSDELDFRSLTPDIRIGWNDVTNLSVNDYSDTIHIDILTGQTKVLEHYDYVKEEEGINGSKISFFNDLGYGVVTVEQGTRKRSLQVRYPESDPSNDPYGFGDAVVDHKGHFLVLGANSYGGNPIELFVINLQDMEIETHLPGLDVWTDKMVWSPNDRYLIATDIKGQLYLYDTTTWAGKPLLDYISVGNVMAWGPDSTQMVIGDTLGNLDLWDAETGELKQTFEGESVPIQEIHWQPNGSLIATLAYNRSPASFDKRYFAQVVNVNGSDDQMPVVQPLNPWLVGFRWSPTGDRLAWVSEGILSIWNQKTNVTEITQTNELSDAWMRERRWNPNEHFIIDALNTLWARDGKSLTAWTSTNVIEIGWDVEDIGVARYELPVEMPAPDDTLGSILPKVSYTFSLPSNEIIKLTRGFASPQGGYVGAVDSVYQGLIWNTETASPVGMLIETLDLVWSPDETLALRVSIDGSVWLLSRQGTILSQLPSRPNKYPKAQPGLIVWSPDNRQVAYLHSGIVEVWQVRP